jgi:hypothetical protein
VRTPSGETGLHPVISSDTKALWAFDRGTGNVVYDLVSGRDCTDASGATWVSGLIGKAADTGAAGHGFTDAVTAAGADSTFALDEWSIECWIRPLATNNGVNPQTIVEYSNAGMTQVPILCTYNGTVGTNYGQVTIAWLHGGGYQQIQSTARIKTGVWTHIVFDKFDAGGGDYNGRIQINGVLDVTGTKSANALAAPAGVWKLGSGGGATGFFGGQICSVHATAATITTEQARTNWRRGMNWQDASQTGHGITYLDVIATTALGGISQNLNEIGYSGVVWDFVRSISIVESVDNQAATATLSLKRQIYELSLAPTMNNSPLNQFPVASSAATGPDARANQDLLVPGTAITIFARRVPNQFGDPNQIALTKGQLIFQGTIDEVEWASDTISVSCVDQGAQLIDTYIEEIAAYNTPNLTSTVQVGMQAVITATLGGAAPALYTPADPSWTIGPWKQRRESVMQAIQSLADQIGWLVKYKWDPITNAFRLTFHDPDRDQTRFDGIVTVNDYSEVATISQALTNVRNVVRITYGDALQPINQDEDGNWINAIATETVSDAASIAAYGRRFMEISESATSNIDTAAEAQAMGNAILADLKQPDTNMSLDLPYWEIEVGDRLVFEANGTTFDQDTTFAVASKTIAMVDGAVATSLQMKEAPASGIQKHIVKESGPGRSLPPTIDPRDAGVDFGRRGFFAPIRGLMEGANLLQQSPSLANIPNPAMLTHPAPSLSAPTGWITTGTWGSYASGGDAYWSSTSETGDRSLALNTVSATATSFWIAVNGGQSYEALCTWQAPDLGDKLEMDVDFYNASRVLTSSNQAFSLSPAVVNTWQTDGLVIPSGSADRFARIVLRKKAGPPILIDRTELNLMSQAAHCFNSGAVAIGAGATAIVWNTEGYDYDAFYNTANGQFTTSQPGIYKFDMYFSYTATVSGTLSAIVIDMKVDGGVVQTTMKEFASGSTSGDHWFHSAPQSLDRGSVVTFEVSVSHAGASAVTTCVGRRITPTER